MINTLFYPLPPHLSQPFLDISSFPHPSYCPPKVAVCCCSTSMSHSIPASFPREKRGPPGFCTHPPPDNFLYSSLSSRRMPDTPSISASVISQLPPSSCTQAPVISWGFEHCKFLQDYAPLPLPPCVLLRFPSSSGSWYLFM